MDVGSGHLRAQDRGHGVTVEGDRPVGKHWTGDPSGCEPACLGSPRRDDHAVPPRPGPQPGRPFRHRAARRRRHRRVGRQRGRGRGDERRRHRRPGGRLGRARVRRRPRARHLDRPGADRAGPHRLPVAGGGAGPGRAGRAQGPRGSGAGYRLGRDRWPEQRPPTAAELDRASYGGVVYLARTDVHSAVASSALLAAAPQPGPCPGSSADGLVRQGAHHVVRRAAYEAVTPSSAAPRRRRPWTGRRPWASRCVHECGGPDIGGEQDFLDLLALEHPVDAYRLLGRARRRRAGSRAGRGRGRRRPVRRRRPGQPHRLPEPALRRRRRSGRAYLDAAQVGRHVAACTRAGLQAGFHAIGDAALQAVADGLALAAGEVGLHAVRAARHRIEHAEMLTPAPSAPWPPTASSPASSRPSTPAGAARTACTSPGSVPSGPRR